MASFKRKLLLSLAITTIFLLRCGLVEGSYSYNGVRYSYSCARWIYMGTTIRWKYGTPLSAPFFGMSYACDSDTSANKRGLHEPSVCGESCRHFCDFENTFFSLRILKDGIALPETDANCQSSPCVDPELGSANVICYNHRLKPDGKTKYTMRLVVDAPHDPDAKPLRNQDADLYIIAGDVVPQNSRGSWASESSITAGSQGRFMLQLMDEFENEVGSETGKEGADLDVEFSVSVTEGHAADPGAVTDLICRRNGNTGTYAVTFTTAKIGDYNLHVQAVIDSRSYSVIGSPFSFRVISGPVDQGKPVMPRVVHKAEKVWADDYPTFKVSSSQADDNAVEGSPFFFTVKAGK
ncbi:hypothetical protein R1sor_026347 [Riccia sorocarpa]|uniref:GEX2 N-terminal Ig-like domain-containing protein n=1 Tax=Riccia sorocarpa TaxID=122646 RepID=A0ABD3GGS9_9MARC